MTPDFKDTWNATETQNMKHKPENYIKGQHSMTAL